LHELTDRAQDSTFRVENGGQKQSTAIISFKTRVLALIGANRWTFLTNFELAENKCLRPVLRFLSRSAEEQLGKTGNAKEDREMNLDNVAIRMKLTSLPDWTLAMAFHFFNQIGQFFKLNLI
jgi:hypothetical protein